MSQELGPGVEISSYLNYPDFVLFHPLPVFLIGLSILAILRFTGFWDRFENKKGEKGKGGTAYFLSFVMVAAVMIALGGAKINKPQMYEDIEEHYGVEITETHGHVRADFFAWRGNYVDYKGDRFSNQLGYAEIKPHQVGEGVHITDENFPRPEYTGFVQVAGHRAWLITNETADGEWAEVEVIPEEHRIEYGGGYVPSEGEEG